MEIHSTHNEKLFLAGGDIFSKECIESHDGMLAFIHKGFNALWNNQQKAMEKDLLKLTTFFIDRIPETCEEVNLRTMRGLSALADQGCRNIVVHGSSVRNASYKEGAKACLYGVEQWLMYNYHKVDSITLIDRNDDFYKKFGTDMETPKIAEEFYKLLRDLKSENCPTQYLEEFKYSEICDIVDRFDGTDDEIKEDISDRLRRILAPYEDDMDVWGFIPDQGKIEAIINVK